MKIAEFLLINISIFSLIVLWKLNEIDKRKQACETNYFQLVRKIEMVLDAYEGEKPHLEIQLVPIQLKEN